MGTGAPDPTRTFETPGSAPVASIGPYNLFRQLGEGGMGVVYHARQSEPIRRDVALKIIKPGMDTRQVISRFETERQALAVMDHPNVARVLDAGATGTGLPYFVMELVDGVPITHYCDSHKLSIRERIAVFIPVCQAIQHAHQKGIIHRDLKPSNILVAEHEGKAVPKVIDFGLAKALGPQMNDLTLMTNVGTVMGTLEYMSPEQAEPGRQDIDTRSDVYSLGAVLYELLIGTTPLEREMARVGYIEALQRIREHETPPPSTRFRRSGSMEIAARRRNDPSQLPKLLRRDLDWIVMKALEKDRTRRYETVNGLASDLERYLAGDPVEAAPPSANYRMGKFARKHRTALATAAAFSALLVAGIAVSTIEARRAERRFAQVRELANTFLFKFYDEVTPLTGSTGVRASIVDTARKYLDGLAGDAGSDKGLTLELAQAYQRLGVVQGAAGFSLGRPEDARRSYERSLELYDRLPVSRTSPAEWRRGRARTLMALGDLEYASYHEVKAAQYYRQALALLDDRAGEGATRLQRASCLRLLGQTLLRSGGSPELPSLLESSRRLLLDLQAGGFADKSLNSELELTIEILGRAKVLMGDLDGGLNDYLDLLRRTAPCDESRPSGAVCRQYARRLAWTADIYAALDRPNLGETEKAAVMYDQSRRIQARLSAEDPQNRQARFDMASMTGKLGDAVWEINPTRAIELYDEALAAAKELASKEQFEMLLTSYKVAISRPLLQLGRTAEAEKMLTEVLREADADPNPPYADRLGTEMIRLILADLLWAERKPNEARQRLQQSIADFEKLHTEHPSDLTPLFFVSNSYRKLASMTAGGERREALLRSAAGWHSWPATSYTRREEQKDLSAAAQVK
jgi:serine/threonine protein kinase